VLIINVSQPIVKDEIETRTKAGIKKNNKENRAGVLVV
jgi:hypothetical protein